MGFSPVFFFSFILGSTKCRSSLEQHSYLHPQNGWNIQNIDEFLFFIQKCEYSSKKSDTILRFYSNWAISFSEKGLLYRLEKKLYNFLAINRQKENPGLA
jgi:hypothetical protein